jgi:hypothetical protein
MRLAYESTNVAYKDRIKIDEDSDLPIPPFWMLFTRTERIIMGLVYQCQLSGKFTECKMQFAKDGKPSFLPQPYRTKSLGSMASKFPFEYCDADGAEHLLTMMVDNRNIVPGHMSQWIELQDAGKDAGKVAVKVTIKEGDEMDVDEEDTEMDVEEEDTEMDLD